MILDNGVELKGQYIFESDGGGFSLSKAEVRKFFRTKPTTLIMTCRSCQKSHSYDFDVVYRDHGGVAIGCTDFTAEDVKKIRRWATSKNGAKP